MRAQATLSSPSSILPFRERYREEMNCQITKDSIHQRAGWSLTYLLEYSGVTAGFGSIAIGGPWKDKPTLFEFYVLPEQRTHTFDLFEALLTFSQAQFMELQSNDLLLAAMLHTYASNIASESIVFHDKITTALPDGGATLRCLTSEKQTQENIQRRQGGPEWLLELDGEVAGKGGILFHYNRPYGDIHMEVAEPFRRRGLGAYLVQELKRAAYDLDAIPAARCNTTNIPSRRTLQRAGFVPCAHILTGIIRERGGAQAE
jgi:hypothetical protein